MRTIAVSTVIVLIIVGLAFSAVPGLWGHAKQFPKDIGMAVDKSVPDSHAEGVYGGEIDKALENLKGLYTIVYNVKVKMAELESVLKTQQQELFKEEQILKRSQELLDKNKPGSTFTIGGAKFTWEEINQEAINHLSNCQILRRQIAGNEQSLSKLRQAHSDGIKAVSDEQERLRRKKMEFEVEKVELVVLRTQEDVDAIVGKVYQATNVKTDLASARKVFEDRLNERRASAEWAQKSGLRKASAVNAVPWDAELGSTKKASIEIQSYFKEGKTEATK